MQTTFAMANDERKCTSAFQHFGADVASEGACNLRTAILTTDGNATSGYLHRARNQRRWHAEKHIGRWRRRLHRGGDRFNFKELSCHAVLLPAFGDQGLRVIPGKSGAVFNARKPLRWLSSKFATR